MTCLMSVTFLSSWCILWDFIHIFFEHNNLRNIFTETKDEKTDVFLQFKFVKFFEHVIIDFDAGCLKT